MLLLLNLPGTSTNQSKWDIPYPRLQIEVDYTLNHIVKVGKYTLPEDEKGKQYATIEYLLQGLVGVGRLLVVDSAYTTFDLLEDAKSKWNTQVTAIKDYLSSSL